MKFECRFEAHDAMRYTLAGENYPLVQRSGKVFRSIESAMDLYKSPSIECSPKNLMVDPSERMRSEWGVRDIVVCENVGIF
jgi:hypothetical protein